MRREQRYVARSYEYHTYRSPDEDREERERRREERERYQHKHQRQAIRDAFLNGRTFA